MSSAWWRLAASGLVLLSMSACALVRDSPSASRSGESQSETEYAEPTPSPPGTELDPLSGLPETAASARMVVSTLGQSSLLYLDVETGSVIPLPDAAEQAYADPVVTPRGAVYVSDSGTLVLFDVDNPARFGTASLPSELEAADVAVTGLVRTDDDLIAETALVESQLSERTVVVFEIDGTLRCRYPGPLLDPPTFASDGSLWLDGLTGRLDTRTCEVTAVPELGHALASSWPMAQSDGNAVYALGKAGLGRFDLGRREWTSARDGFAAWDLSYASGKLWAIDGSRVVALDPITLQETSEVFTFECGDGAHFVGHLVDRLYVIDDCDRVFVEIDPARERAVQSWYYPDDGVSDSQVDVRTTSSGFWFVDTEQTGVPYFFDVTARRFERLPFGPSVLENVYALTFDVSN